MSNATIVNNLVKTILPTMLPICVMFKNHLSFFQGTFGQNCTYLCHCFNNETCDHINGSCPENVCTADWSGDNCSIGGPYIKLSKSCKID